MDNNESDGTPFADPAYWRGHDAAVAGLCYRINLVLDGKDTGHGVSQEPWESTRRRILELVNDRI